MNLNVFKRIADAEQKIADLLESQKQTNYNLSRLIGYIENLEKKILTKDIKKPAVSEHKLKARAYAKAYYVKNKALIRDKARAKKVAQKEKLAGRKTINMVRVTQ